MLVIGPWESLAMADMRGVCAPAGMRLVCDVRSLNDQSTLSQSRRAYGIFEAAAETIDHRPLTAAAVRDMLGLVVRGDGRAAIDDLLTTVADPHGDYAPRPVMPRGNGLLSWVDRPLRRDDLATIEQLRDTFAAIYSEDTRLARKWLGYTARKLSLRGNEWEMLQPRRLRGISPLHPETTITESFNTSDGTTLGPDLSWTEDASAVWEISTNRAYHNTTSTGTNNRVARANSDLSSDDHYSQVVAKNTSLSVAGGNGQIGAACRFSASATNTYYFAFNDPTIFYTFKVLSYTFTQLAIALHTYAQDDIYRCTCDGSSISGQVNGTTTAGPTTDTAISGNVRCGMYGLRQVYMDSFEAADLASGTTLSLLLEGGMLNGGFQPLGGGL